METWRNIPGTDGKYLIDISTKEGRCKNAVTGYIFKNAPHKRDHRINWCLHYGGKNHNKQAAVWIALTYPELVANEWFKGAEIDHINTDRMDNRPENLRWVTRRENLNNPLTRKHRSECLTGRANKKLQKPVRQYTLSGELVAEFSSITEAHKKTGLRHISECCRGIFKSSSGYRWEFI